MGQLGGRRVGRSLAILIAGLIAVLAGPGLSHASAGGGPGMGGGMNRKILKKWGISPAAMKHMEMPTKLAWIPYAPALHPHGWSVAASSSRAGHPASELLAPGTSGWWQSARLGGRARLPLTLTIRFGRPETITGLRAIPRAGRGEVGRFSVSLSRDGRHFGAAVAYGRWQSNPTVKQVGWSPRTVRALRLRVQSTSPGRARAVAVSRLTVLGQHRPDGAAARTGSTHAHAAAASTNPSVVGKWGPTIAFPLVPVAAALLPGNKLLTWSADEDLSFGNDGSPYTQTAILDLNTGAISTATVSNTAHNMFCPGVSILANGDVIVTGGISDTLTSIYDPSSGTWSAAPQMNIGRGYQGQTTLSDGQAFVLGGSWSGAIGGKLGEVFSPTGAWRELTGVPANPMYTSNDPQGVYREDNHGWFIATSGGNVLQAGPSAEMHWITTTGAGTITDAGPRGTAGDEMNGNAVLYAKNQILAVGGSPAYQDSDATTVANTIHISGTTAQVAPTGAMSFPRGFANSVALPNGHVFTVGGETYPIPFDDSTSVMTPEMWSPSTGQWTEMADQAEPRNYHSVGVLLPDGTVFSGGGGLCGTCSTNHPDGQIYNPPYLFKASGALATRPTIASAPSTASTGQTIPVSTGGPVQSFVMMRYDESTHSVDNDQRRVPLTISSQSGNTYQLRLPSSSGVLLPGPYMLFAMNSKGVPSVASTVFVSTPSASTSTSPYGAAVDKQGPALYWPLSDAAGAAAAADQSGNRDLGAVTGSGASFGTPSPVETAGGHGLALASGGQVISTQPQYTPSTFSESLWFRTTSAGGSLATYGDSATGVNGSQDRMIYMTAGGQLAFGVYPGSTQVIESPQSYADGAWHSVVATQGSDGMHLYVDGHQVASGAQTGAQSYTGYWQLGGAANAGWPQATTGAFSGSLSDAALFLRELSPAEVLSDYQASAAAGG